MGGEGQGFVFPFHIVNLGLFAIDSVDRAHGKAVGALRNVILHVGSVFVPVNPNAHEGVGPSFICVGCFGHSSVGWRLGRGGQFFH